MKIITDEQYAAINKIIKDLNVITDDESGYRDNLEYYKSIIDTNHAHAYYDDKVEMMIDIIEKSFKGEDWAVHCINPLSKKDIESLKILAICEKMKDRLVNGYDDDMDFLTEDELLMCKNLNFDA